MGKLLSINKDGTIPSDNPFYNNASGQNRAIWARGFRNPSTFAVHPGTGRIFVNDVGDATWEEINDLAKGANYGWGGRRRRQRHRGRLHRIGAQVPQPHQRNLRHLRRGLLRPATQDFPSDYLGDFFYSDYCAGWIKRWDPVSGSAATFTATFREASGRLFEAEIAARSGPLVTTRHPGYTGRGYLDFQSNAGNWVEWNVGLSAAGTVPLVIRYSNGGGGMTVRLQANGSTVTETLSLPATGAWSNWAAVTRNVALRSGSNLVRITTTGSGQPNVDHLRVP